MNLKPIGVVRSPMRAGADEGWGAVIATVEVDPTLAEGLRGPEQFSHLLVIFYMHEATFDAADLVRQPRGCDDMPLLGIFAQRAKQRLNPSGNTGLDRADHGRVFLVRASERGPQGVSRYAPASFIGYNSAA